MLPRIPFRKGIYIHVLLAEQPKEHNRIQGPVTPMCFIRHLRIKDVLTDISFHKWSINNPVIIISQTYSLLLESNLGVGQPGHFLSPQFIRRVKRSLGHKMSTEMVLNR